MQGWLDALPSSFCSNSFGAKKKKCKQNLDPWPPLVITCVCVCARASGIWNNWKNWLDLTRFFFNALEFTACLARFGSSSSVGVEELGREFSRISSICMYVRPASSRTKNKKLATLGYLTCLSWETCLRLFTTKREFASAMYDIVRYKHSMIVTCTIHMGPNQVSW